MMNMPINNMNTISSFNKVFDQNVKQFGDNFQESDKQFENILSQQSMNMDNRSQMFSGGIELNVGLENMGITPMEPIMESQKTGKNMTAVERTASDFGRALHNGLNSVNDAQISSERATEIMASGGDISTHEVMIASEKAGLAMQMAIQMRNKIIQAYNEIKDVRI